MPSTARPDPSEYGAHFARYIALVPAGDLLAHLDVQASEIAAWSAGLTEAQAAHRYAPGKWSVREVIGHVADTERIFAYRALRIARGDATPLPSFDENAYASHAAFEARSMADVAAEFAAVRGASLALLRGLPEAAWTRRGTVSGGPVSVRALASLLFGHAAHHRAILAERYDVA